MQIKKDSNTDIFLVEDKNILFVQSKADFNMDFKPEVKYSKFHFYSKASIFRYVETKNGTKVILSVNSKTHRNIHFIFYKDLLKINGFNTIKELLNNDVFFERFKEIIMKENTGSVFDDAKEFLNDF